MSDITPPYWVGGNPGAAFAGTNAAVAANQANMLANYNANLAYVGAQNQASLNNAYGPQGFGGQTAYYAGQGAAYGRNTGGYGGYGGMNDPLSPVGGYNSLDAQAFDRAAAQQYLDANPDVADYATKNSLDPLWEANQHAITQGASEGRNTFGLGGGGSVFNTGAPAYNDYGGGANPGGFSPSPNYPGGAQQPMGSAFNLYGQPGAGGGGFDPSAFRGFDPATFQTGISSYLSNRPDVAAYATSHGYDPGQFAMWHAANRGTAEGTDLYGLPRDAEQAYLAQYNDVKQYATEHNLDPEWFADQHAATQGVSEGRNTFGLAGHLDNAFSQLGVNPTQQQNQPAIDAVNGFAGRGTGVAPYQTPYDNNSPFNNFDAQAYLRANPDVADYATAHSIEPTAFAREHVSTMAVPEHRDTFGWVPDSYGNNVPPPYQNTGADMYNPATYGGNPGFNPVGGQAPGYGPGSAVYNAPSSGAIGPYSDTFTGYPYGGGTPQAQIDNRFPQYDFATQNYINQLNQGLNNIGGGSTLQPGDFNVSGGNAGG